MFRWRCWVLRCPSDQQFLPLGLAWGLGALGVFFGRHAVRPALHLSALAQPCTPGSLQWHLAPQQQQRPC